MKSFTDIYNSIINSFKKRTNLEITEGTVLDSYVLASTDALFKAHQEIENSKDPHIFTKLRDENIDKMALLINCPRYPNETDESYLYRCMNWTLINESCNSTAIESAISNLTYASNAHYVPYTQGTGTATIFIIPKTYDEETKKDAINELKDRLKKVISPDSYIKYEISQPLQIRVIVYASFNKTYDIKLIKKNIEEKVKTYINSIAIGDRLSYGDITKIGINEVGVNFFNPTHIYIDGKLLSSLNTVQTIQNKFLYYDIIWETVVE